MLMNPGKLNRYPRFEEAFSKGWNGTRLDDSTDANGED